MPTTRGRLTTGDHLERRGTRGLFVVSDRIGVEDYAVRVYRKDGEPFLDPRSGRTGYTMLILHADQILAGRDPNWCYVPPQAVPAGPPPPGNVVHIDSWLAVHHRRPGRSRALSGRKERR